MNNCKMTNGEPDHRQDVHLACTGTLEEPASAAQEKELAPLTARFEDLPASHDGETAFTFRLVLSEDVANTADDLRDSAFEVSGGSVTGVSRAYGRSDLWEITVAPDGAGNIGIALQVNAECGTAGALCTADGRELTTPLLATVAADPATVDPADRGLTARFTMAPDEHDGEAAFTVELTFSEAPAGNGMYGMKNIVLRNALSATGGSVTRVHSIDGNGAHRRITLQPAGTGPVDLELPARGPACGESNAICTESGGRLELSVLTRIRGPAALRVEDAEVQEGPGATLAFAVTLNRATSGTVRVDYATSDGTAEAGFGLHGGVRHARFRAGRDSEDGRGRGAGRFP